MNEDRLDNYPRIDNDQKPTELNYCKDCNSFGLWERFPAGDWHTKDHTILEYSYRCSKCGHITLRPCEAILPR